MGAPRRGDDLKASALMAAEIIAEMRMRRERSLGFLPEEVIRSFEKWQPWIQGRIEKLNWKVRRQALVDQLSSFLHLFSSEYRAHALLYMTAFQPPEIFWPVFLNCWSGCDDTWCLRKDLLLLFERYSEQVPALRFADSEDRAFYESLPEKIVVYRGTSRSRVRGLSWTIDGKIAEGFAHGHRGMRLPDGVVCSAKIDKETGIFFVSVSRQESETVLNPRRLSRLRVEPYSMAACFQ
jgi:hypothetical protein